MARYQYDPMRIFCFTVYLRPLSSHDLYIDEAKTDSQELKFSGTELRKTHKTIACNIHFLNLECMKLMYYKALFEINSYHISCSLAKEI